MNPITVLDIGARSGFQSVWDNSLYPVRVIGFEPDPEECRRLNLSTNKSEKTLVDAKYFPVALAGERGPRTLYLFNDRRLSSFFLPNKRWLKRFPLDKLLGKKAFEVVSQVELECLTLDEFDAEHLAGKADYIKLDTQGSELEILQGGSRVLGNVFAVCTEVEFGAIYNNQPLFADIDSFLRREGFTLFDLNRHWWKRAVPESVFSRGQMVFADALYLRDYWNPSYIGSYWSNVEGSPENVEKTIALSALLGYSDYALQLADQFEKVGTITSLERESIVKKYILHPLIQNSSVKIMGNIAGRLAAKFSKLRTALGASLEMRHAIHLNREFYDNDERKSFRHIGR